MPPSGVLIDAVAGDMACYLSLRDEAGKPFEQMASFELCDEAPPWIGKAVALSYGPARILADSCQGNMDCSESQEVMLVTSMRPIQSKPQHATLCHDATAVFECQVASGKQVAVCTSDKSGAQYRFGKHGAIEMSLRDQSHGRIEAFAGGGGAWLRFTNGKFGYVVFSGIGRWGDNGETVEKAGVVVEKDGSRIAYQACKTLHVNEFSPDWFEAQGYDPDDPRVFEFPD